MLTELEVIEIAENYVAKISQKWEIELAIAEEYSILKNYGTIFYFNSKKYVKDKIERELLIGCAPMSRICNP